MSITLVLSTTLVVLAAVALGASVYLAVRPRPTPCPGRLTPVTWQLVRGGLTAACATAGAACVLTVVSLSARP